MEKKFDAYEETKFMRLPMLINTDVVPHMRAWNEHWKRKMRKRQRAYRKKKNETGV